jgi:hypothetical protein
MKGPKLNRDWIGLRVRLITENANGYARLQPGTEGYIRNYSPKGIEFESDKCECCSVRVFMTRLQRSDVEIITPEEKWPDTRKKKK